jgi:hypothetical protein
MNLRLKQGESLSQSEAKVPGRRNQDSGWLRGYSDRLTHFDASGTGNSGRNSHGQTVAPLLNR